MFPSLNLKREFIGENKHLCFIKRVYYNKTIHQCSTRKRSGRPSSLVGLLYLSLKDSRLGPSEFDLIFRWSRWTINTSPPLTLEFTGLTPVCHPLQSEVTEYYGFETERMDLSRRCYVNSLSYSSYSDLSRRYCVNSLPRSSDPRHRVWH